MVDTKIIYGHNFEAPLKGTEVKFEVTESELGLLRKNIIILVEKYSCE